MNQNSISDFREKLTEFEKATIPLECDRNTLKMCAFVEIRKQPQNKHLACLECMIDRYSHLFRQY